MAKRSLEDRKIARELVSRYQANLPTFTNFLTSLQDQIRTSPKLAPYIHSLKWRTKSIDSLEGKIYRKLDDAKKENEAFEIDVEKLIS